LSFSLVEKCFAFCGFAKIAYLCITNNNFIRFSNMNDEKRLEILDKIHYLKKVYDTHATKKIIKDEAKRNEHLFAIIDAIRELEEELKSDLDNLN
jgi:hypothetical protein